MRVLITFPAPVELKKRLEKIAQENEIPVSQLIRVALASGIPETAKRFSALRPAGAGKK